MALARARTAAKTAGVTRLGRLTGLDTLGCPVSMAVRPASRSSVVALGKGVTADHADVSALMESIETWHAETISADIRLDTAEDLIATGAEIGFDGAPLRAGAAPGLDDVIPWVESVDLLSGGSLWVPFELVTAAYLHPPQRGFGHFHASTNGLASGFTPVEALTHALTEVIERDAVTLWRLSSDAAQDERRVRLDTVDAPGCAALIARFQQAGMLVAIWDVTSDIGLPCFFAWIMEADAGVGGAARSAVGSGCHLAADIALSRALTEAAQARLTIISGARDDLGPEDYAAPSREVAVLQRQMLTELPEVRAYSEAPSLATPSLRADLDLALDRLEASGVTRVAALDLSKPAIGAPVVRVIAYGLEGPSDDDIYNPGARARKLEERAAA